MEGWQPNHGTFYTCSDCPKSHQSYPFVQPVSSAGLVDMCNVSNKVLGRSVTNGSLLSIKVTEIPPFGGKQLFMHKVDKVI